MSSNAGRKNVYDSKIKPKLEEIKTLRLQGYTEKSIAKQIGVGLTSFSKWKGEKDEFSLALRIGKENLVAELSKSLYQIAMGYEKEEVRIEKKTGGLNNGEVKTTIRTKHYAPNLGALIFSLKNLDPDNWKDKPESNFEEDVMVKLEKIIAEGRAEAEEDGEIIDGEVNEDG